MDVPRVPDDDRGWEAIDIFIFNNGEESAPPRKYHLKGEQLEWWGITLTHLAKSQYGDAHSEIDLYTMDGHKISNPLQLSNGATYVAVPPAIGFVEAGYEKYLLKATRSWEKRQLRKENNSVLAIKPDELDENEDIEQLNLNEESSAVHTIVPSNSNNTNRSSIVIKPQHQRYDRHSILSQNQNLQRANVVQTNLRQPSQEKKPNQPPSSVKKFSSTVPSQSNTMKTTFKRKDNGNGNGKANVKVTPAKDRTSISGIETPKSVSAVKTRMYNRPVRNFKTMEPEVKLPKVEELVEELKPLANMSNNFNKSVTLTETSQSNPITNLYNNVNSEAPSLFVNLIELPETEINDITPKNNDQTIINTFKNQKMFVGVTGDDNKNNDTYVTNLAQPITDVPVEILSDISKTQSDHNMPHKDEIVNVNLNIEIWNHGDKSTIKINNAGVTDDTIRAEKCSQSDIRQECLGMSPSFQNELEKQLNSNRDDNNRKIIVMKCPCFCKCSNNLGSKNANRGDKTDPRELFIFLPILQLDQEKQSCNCKQNGDINVQTKAVPNPQSSIINPIKRTSSCISLTNIMTVVENENTSGESHVTQAKLTPNIPKDVDVPNRTESCISKRKSVAINETLNTNEPQPPSAFYRVSVQSSTVVIKNEDKIVMPNTNTTATQTEWNNIMLEAKPQMDGHYKFQLPSLECLKKYNKLYTK